MYRLPGATGGHMRARILRCGGLFAIALLLVPAGVTAQSTHGSIVGTVTDESGAVMPGVSVTVTNADTNIARTVVTNQSGYYEVLALVPGTYRVHAEMIGFTPTRREGLI